MRICLILEGCYPYVNGGVSSWMHQYINEMTEHEFVLVTIGAQAKSRGNYKYQLADHVVEVRELFLDEMLSLPAVINFEEDFTEQECQELKKMITCDRSLNWDVIFDIFYTRKCSPTGFLQSEVFLDLLIETLEETHNQKPFSEVFHSCRSMLVPILSLISQGMPQADVYHSIATGYAGVLASLGSYLHSKPLLLTEHGIYTREREEEILGADWVLPSMKNQWIQFFYMLSDAIYKRATKVTSLFTHAMFTQQEFGCDIDKCQVISNGIHYDRFAPIPLKEEDGWVDIAAIVRIAPIKDIKTMLYAYYELSLRMDNVRLHILGGIDDEIYNQECHQLIRQLGVKNIVFPGQVDVVAYLERIDFTILTSISEGQPLSVLESMAARRPCVTTDVGCCRELLEGKPDDTLGASGFVVPPTHRILLADALEKMAKSRELRIKMGEIGQKRVAAEYRYETMIEQYRTLYKEVS